MKSFTSFVEQGLTTEIAAADSDDHDYSGDTNDEDSIADEETLGDDKDNEEQGDKIPNSCPVCSAEVGIGSSVCQVCGITL